ncbi:hypothetical protein N7516_009386 [Penicillium verrucosum]|uniref:uncharacterized protein n=1 Tax=Penicillium verrucosum TaxID=60171 RepID=UPI002545A815|nr:uncharacterized protein N7516_009386 [Penicillium verrucosum]KAJ5927613.1 hypothetical protein N7516_009386 [Penicillium verrucosum]
MSADDPFSFLPAEQAKPAKKTHWKTKLFSKDKNKAAPHQNQEIADFLSSRTPESIPAPPPIDPRYIPPQNVAHPFPSSQDISGYPPSKPVPAPAPALPRENYAPYNPSDQSSTVPPTPPSVKPGGRKGKGLRVGFSPQTPEVIGEGGDETESPTIEISRARERSDSRGTQSGSIPLSDPSRLHLPNLRLDTSLGDDDARSQQAAYSPQRNISDWKPPLIQNTQDADFLRTMPSSDSGSRLSFRGDSEASSFAQRVRDKMQAEEGRALHHRYEEETLSPGAEDDDVSPPPVLPSRQGFTDPRQTATPGPACIKPAVTSQSRRPRAATQRPTPKFSLRNIANQVGDTAFSEFKEYNARYEGSIKLAAEDVKPLAETSLAEWIRAAVWWFLRGKTRLEAYARSRSTLPPTYAKQAVVDLGKALWINENIVPSHHELSRYGAKSVDAVLAVASTTGDKELADLLSIHHTLINHLRSLSMSIKRNNILASVVSDEGSPTQLDTSIWLRYPFYAPDVSAVLSGAATRSMLVDNAGKIPSLVHMMPLADTARYFSYGSMFVQVCVSSSDDDGQQQYAMPCALTIVRERADWTNLGGCGLASPVPFYASQAPRGFELDVMFKEDDFKTLWNIVKYTQKSENSLHPEAGETVVFENTVKVFQYMDPGTPKAFPSDPTERCRLRLFERSVTVTEGTGTRNAHRGFRLAVLTSPKVKTLSSIRHTLGNGSPIVFGLLRGEDGAPALLLKVTEDGRTRSMLMTFHEAAERTKIHSILLGMIPREGEIKSPEFAIQSYCIEQPEDPFTGQPAVKYLQFPAGSVSVIDQEHAYVDHGYGPTILSEHLRAFVATEWGSVTDRINLGPGELKIGLDVQSKTSMSLFRSAQQDLTLSLADNLIRPELAGQLTGFLEKLTAKPMVRRLEFPTMQDLHAFEAAVTGFQVLYDGMATSFTISRRRSMVPIYKKWEAALARVQIVRQEKVVQMLAFFGDFQHGTCMNFVLKGTDIMESFGRSGKFGIRMVDAKFALPKKDDDPASNFVCLDMPEYPIEHDDLTVTFDTEASRASFKAALPGSVREPSRMGSIRR